MKSFFILFFAFFTSSLINAQVSPDKYWVRFTDKNNSPYSIDQPEEFLSQRAIDRRERFDIPIVENDLPVNPSYILAIEDIGVQILNASKWFNSVTIYTTNPANIDVIETLPFVLSVEKASGQPKIDAQNKKLEIKEPNPGVFPYPALKASNSFDYGYGFTQIDQINGIPLHDAGFDGTGMVIAVLDGGFTNADNLACFDSLWMNNRILGTKDFVDPSGNNVFQSSTHGTKVLSTMGAWLPGQLVGTAPNASYYLCRTEDVDSEYLIEELNYVSGAEYADSVGADIINASLSYAIYDDPEQTHVYEELDGNTILVTIGADMAASKGILVVNSAGNYGSDNWYYIGAPADGNEVCTVGAVNAYGEIVGFSSHGPTADGRIKPDVCAMGSYAAVIDPSDGTVTTGSGTSFSSPITAGMMACLWQTNPLATNMEILEAAKMSANYAANPNNNYGWGIPDYTEAMDIISGIDIDLIEKEGSYYVYPNPFTGRIVIAAEDTSTYIEKIKIIDAQGKIIYEQNIGQKITPYGKFSVEDLDALPTGYYVLQVITDTNIHERKIIKQQ